MIPLNIALGPKAVRYILDNPVNRLKMEQHCVLYSDKMLDIYIERDCDAAEALMGYIDAHEGEVGFSKKLVDKVAVNEPIEQILENMCPKEKKFFPSNIVILFENGNGREIKALSKKKANVLSTKEMDENPKNIFNMLSPDTGALDVEVGEDCCYWAEYFARIIEGESTVLFMNRYGLTSDSIQSLKEYYLPYLSKGIKIIMYASEIYSNLSKEKAIKVITEDAILNKFDIELYLIDEPNQSHERWIQTDNYFIYQGKGVSMLSSNRTNTVSASSTVLVEKRRRNLPNAERVL